jgi:hypothetical protein
MNTEGKLTKDEMLPALYIPETTQNIPIPKPIKVDIESLLIINLS